MPWRGFLSQGPTVCSYTGTLCCTHLFRLDSFLGVQAVCRRLCVVTVIIRCQKSHSSGDCSEYGSGPVGIAEEWCSSQHCPWKHTCGVQKKYVATSCMLVGGCGVDSWCKTLLHFRQVKVWAEDDWKVACSFCLLRLSFAASCLSA